MNSLIHSNLINNATLIAVAILFILLVLLGSALLLRQKSYKLDKAKFRARWQEVQGLCRKSETWPLAVINADKLLDEALKKTHCRGRTMGERLVFAQRRLSDNDGVWFGHKLRNKIVHEEVPHLQQRDVQMALQGLRQALKDLGALE